MKQSATKMKNFDLTVFWCVTLDETETDTETDKIGSYSNVQK